LEKSGKNEQEIVLFIEGKEDAIPRGLPNNQYRINALRLLNSFVCRKASFGEEKGQT
jgi:hypothetical protein